MPEQQNFEPIDRVFRNAFQDMSETPAPTGWDQPSARVWKGIQSRLSRPSTSSRFPVHLLLLVSGAVAFGALAWYISVSTSNLPVEVAVPASQESDTPSVITSSSAENVAPIITPKATQKPSYERAAPSQIEVEEDPSIDQKNVEPTFNKALPPNSVERNKQLENAAKNASPSVTADPDTIRQ
jgi:hypothetical protein